MNNPSDQPIDEVEQRVWLAEHKAITGLSWTDLSKRTGIATGTISQFGVGTYKGDNVGLARKIFQYRQHLISQAEIEIEAPKIPGYFDTPTSRQIMTALRLAQRGRIVVVATGPGTGKTVTTREYRERVSNVWQATISPSCASVVSMQVEVLAALGERDAMGTPQRLSRRIKERVRETGGLIAIDEAQHLTERSIEEIRSWHDATGIGIALLGNETVLSRIEGGSRKAAYAQLYSRVGFKMVQNLPTSGDAEALADAWNITDDKQIAFITKVAAKPGGLRGCTFMLELAAMLAAGEARRTRLSDLQDAWTQLSSRPVPA